MNVLVIDDDAVIRSNILELLEAEGYRGIGAADGKAGVAAALAKRPDVIICDITMPVMDGHQVLRRIRDYPETAAVPFVFLTARAQREDVREGMALGADDYLTKPFTRQELLTCIRSRVARQQAIVATLSPTTGSQPPVGTSTIVESKALRDVYERAMLAARSNLSVLLLGETGVGKDVLARDVHKRSPRAERPFIPLNCAALTATLLESELFGHERGAFTGASISREGLFEAADGGTVFLDEVGDLPATTQAKLLRVLEDRRVRRIGARTFRDVDVRFIAATNHDLEKRVADGTFRQDLYFRIAGIVLTVPPLRERPEEIVPLAHRFADNVCRQMGRPTPRLTPETLEKLTAHAWPGNVRELRNVIEQCVALCEGDAILPEHLPCAVLDAPPPASTLDALRSEVRELEKQQIIAALDEHGGNQTEAAKALGISRRTLLHRLDEFNLPRPRKK